MRSRLYWAGNHSSQCSFSTVQQSMKHFQPAACWPTGLPASQGPSFPHVYGLGLATSHVSPTQRQTVNPYAQIKINCERRDYPNSPKSIILFSFLVTLTSRSLPTERFLGHKNPTLPWAPYIRRNGGIFLFLSEAIRFQNLASLR